MNRTRRLASFGLVILAVTAFQGTRSLLGRQGQAAPLERVSIVISNPKDVAPLLHANKRPKLFAHPEREWTYERKPNQSFSAFEIVQAPGNRWFSSTNGVLSFDVDVESWRGVGNLNKPVRNPASDLPLSLEALIYPAISEEKPDGDIRLISAGDPLRYTSREFRRLPGDHQIAKIPFEAEVQPGYYILDLYLRRPRMLSIFNPEDGTTVFEPDATQFARRYVEVLP